MSDDTQSPMKALTLIQPWLWSIVDGPKRVENRKWKPWPEVVGQTIALHAGKTYDDEAADILREYELEPPARGVCIQSAIVGVARVASFVRGEAGDPIVMPDQMKWFFGPYGWLLEDVRKLREPVPCKGALALWRLPPAIEAAVLERLPG